MWSLARKMFLLLMRIRLMSTRNVIRHTVRRYPLLAGGLSLLGTGFFVGIFAVFWLLFSLANQFHVLPELIYQIFFFLFLFLLSGAVPFVASTLLHSGDYSLLFSAPLPPRAVTAAKLLDATVTNSLQFTVLGCPALFAAAAAVGLPLWGWLCVPLLVGLFVLLPALIIALALLLILAAVGVRRLRSAISLLNALSGVVVCLTLIAEFGQQGLGTGGFQELLTARVETLAKTSPAAHFAPSAWFSALFLGLGDQGHGANYGAVLLSAGWILLTVGALFGLCLWLGGRLLTAANIAEEDEGDTVRGSSAVHENSLWRRLLTAPVAALIAKDLKYIRRDSVLVSQMGMPLVLFAVPFLLAFQNRELHELAFPLAVVMIAIILFMQTSILSLSSIGLEGRSFWVTLASPTSGSTLLWAKFALSTLISGGIALTLLVLAGVVFHTSLSTLGLLLGAVVLVAAGLCGLNVGISAAFPRFVYENPAHRVSAWALILGFAGSVSYLLVVGGIVSVIVMLLMQPEFNTASTGWLYGIGASLLLLITLLAILIPMKLGAQRIERYPWEH